MAMESVQFVKGYGKLNPSDDRPQINRQLRRRIIAVALIISLTLIAASLVVAAVIRHNAAKPNESKPSDLAGAGAAESLRTVCAVTRFPDSCISSISPLNSPPAKTPLAFFNLSLRAAAVEVSGLKDLAGRSEKPEPAARDCAELVDDSASQLGRSAELMIRVENVLTEMSVSSLLTWISAAMTDLDTCLDGLDETGSTALVDFKMKVKKSEEYMSNTLAILNNMQSLSDKFGLKTP
ncbi:pectinesterase 1 [Andrographis paniculata]|uniref:pectinesterase 1 n=1 Tax=Andrographis paniculata TaxID=175694 RepID=UPI0021E72083|nr:pectinesterase 1 [Andrographis paniculata]